MTDGLIPALRGVLLGASMAFCGTAAWAETLTIASPGVALHFYPFYVAEKAGFFKEEGIELDWVDVGSGAKQIAAVAGGSASFAVVGMQSAISARQNGADLVSIAALFNAYPIQLVLSNAALEKSGIDPAMGIDDKVARLKGLNIAVTGIGSTTDVLLRSWLQARGKDPEAEITIQPLGNPGAMYAAFSQGQVDGFMLGAPFTQRAELEGLGKTAIDPQAGGIPELENVPYTAIITNERTAAAKPELMQKSVNALAKAMKLTREDPAKVQALIKEYFPDTPNDIYLAFEPKFRANAATTPVMTPQEYDNLIKWIGITSDAKIDVTYDAFVVTGFAQKAADQFLK
jgi:NitT/TauT family transport system substrate-binding protein